MSRIEIISAFSAAMEANNFEQAGTYLDEAFTLSGPTPQPVGKHEFLAMQSAFQRAFPSVQVRTVVVVEVGAAVGVSDENVGLGELGDSNRRQSTCQR